MCSSFQMPISPCVILPSGEIAVASTMTSPAPPTAREPRCTRCQSLASPSMLEYWHIGETAIRFLSVMPRSVSGENKESAMPENGRHAGRVPGAELRARAFEAEAHVCELGFGAEFERLIKPLRGRVGRLRRQVDADGAHTLGVPPGFLDQ